MTMAFVTPAGFASKRLSRKQDCWSLQTSLRRSTFRHDMQSDLIARMPAGRRSTLRMVAVSVSKAGEARSPAVDTFDVVVIGGGPAGLSLSSGLGSRGVRVLCADINLDKPWPNNYGTWVDELEPLGLADCTSHVWPRAAAFVQSDGSKSSLHRPYARVDRHAMKARFLECCERSGNVTVVKAIASAVDVSSSADSTFVSLEIRDGQSEELRKVSGRVVVDATGHSLKFVKFNEGDPPGFQAAYGIDCVVSEEGYPYDADEMLLMDFRDDHMKTTERDRAVSNAKPTFIYVMPLDNGVGRRVFFEETSLVASPAMDFEELKERLYRRLDFYNIKVDEVKEEEFCLIPMGGEMPLLRQRVVAFGGAAALVHPATGYMIARALKLADEAAEIIASELKHDGDADKTAHRIWDRLWSQGRRRQRDFFNFGGEYLRKIDLVTTREFFAAFFDLPKDEWAGFLSFRLLKPLERLSFGLGVFARTTNRVRASIVFDAIVNGRIPLLMSVLPVYDVKEDQ